MQREQKLVPVKYANCTKGHTTNILSPGVSDPAGLFAVEHEEGNTLSVDWPCHICSVPDKPVPEATVLELRKQKYGY